eukprot:scaffold42301_cov27-Tisochrysis_lutea.AAC.3
MAEAQCPWRGGRVRGASTGAEGRGRGAHGVDESAVGLTVRESRRAGCATLYGALRAVPHPCETRVRATSLQLRHKG